MAWRGAIFYQTTCERLMALNRGVGLGIALAFAEEGANVAICGRDKGRLVFGPAGAAPRRQGIGIT